MRYYTLCIQNTLYPNPSKRAGEVEVGDLRAAMLLYPGGAKGTLYRLERMGEKRNMSIGSGECSSLEKLCTCGKQSKDQVRRSNQSTSKLRLDSVQNFQMLWYGFQLISDKEFDYLGSDGDSLFKCKHFHIMILTSENWCNMTLPNWLKKAI